MPKKLETSTGMVRMMVMEVKSLITMLRLLEMTEANASIIPLKMFFNDKGRAKIEIALGRGKKLHDKRETEKKRTWERERGRLMRLKG